MRAHDVVFYPCGVAHRNLHVAFRIHDVDLSYLVEASLLDDLKMSGRSVTNTTVCRVALHNGTVGLINKILNKLRPQIIALRRLARRDFYRHVASRAHSQRLKNPYQRLCRYLVSEINIALRKRNSTNSSYCISRVSVSCSVTGIPLSIPSTYCRISATFH